MNCKQLDELLPLYAGRDLDEKRARLVSEHLQICAACARVAGEYRETFELTQQFAPPVFSGNAYASVRRQVMEQIEDEPAAPLLPQMFGSWFRPRMTWAVASALVVAFAVFALYFIAHRGAANGPIAINQGTVRDNERGEGQGPEAPPASTAPSATSEPKKPRRSKPKSVRNSLRTGVIAANRRSSAEPNSLPVNDSVHERTLRVEIQTKDPNIRIIWFSQSNPKPALPNSKGI